MYSGEPQCNRSGWGDAQELGELPTVYNLSLPEVLGGLPEGPLPDPRLQVGKSCGLLCLPSSQNMGAVCVSVAWASLQTGGVPASWEQAGSQHVRRLGKGVRLWYTRSLAWVVLGVSWCADPWSFPRTVETLRRKCPKEKGSPGAEQKRALLFASRCHLLRPAPWHSSTQG